MSKLSARPTEEDARELWEGYTRTRELPAGIPANPDEVYADQGWAGWRDWMGIHVERDEAPALRSS